MRNVKRLLIGGMVLAALLSVTYSGEAVHPTQGDLDEIRELMLELREKSEGSQYIIWK